MKKYIIVSALIFAGSFAFGQTEYDALRMSQTSLTGSARYMGMGGAFGALGADATAIKDNPAGLGVFRSSEIAFTINGAFQSNNADWKGKHTKESGNNLRFDALSYVMAMPIYNEGSGGLVGSNFSFTYNKVRDFNRSIMAKGTNVDRSFTDFISYYTTTANRIEQDLQKKNNYDPYVERNSDGEFAPWLAILGYNGYLINPKIENKLTTWHSNFPGQLVNPTSIVLEKGSVNEYGFGWAGNFDNKFFLGVNANIYSLNYNLESTLGESFSNANFTLTNYLSQTGTGFNVKIGGIYLPTNNLRLGVSVHTPTFYSISETMDFKLLSSQMAPNMIEQPTKMGSQEYNLQTPLQAQASIAYLFGRKGLLSAEYNFINYPGMRLRDSGSNSSSFGIENEGMSKVFRNGHVFKIGAEYKPMETVALRTGYGFATSPNNPDYKEGKALRLNSTTTATEYFENNNTQYISLGAGYRQSNWFLDLAYVLRWQKDKLYSYQGAYAADISTSTNNIVATLGFKF